MTAGRIDTAQPTRRRDAILVALVGLGARLAVVAWAASRFPPAGDGFYYETLARRIAAGLGYTWLWPDGAVTYAAHYPVGYPAIVAALYAVVGAHPCAAMVLNAAIGAGSAVAAHALAARAASPRIARAAGLLVALHPGLVFYTPALMTEGVTAALVVFAAATAAWARSKGHLAGAAAIGFVVGAATLIRPQALLVAPAFAALAFWPRGSRRVLSAAALALAAALVVCVPWTARNCVRMHRCALVSVNGGWNLLIGADPSSTGAWSPIQVPPACSEVWDEAEKDACFERAALDYITDHPADWLALVPKKLGATFDYPVGAPWYLHESNPEAFDGRAKFALGAVEIVFDRLVVIFALAFFARRDGSPRPRARIAVAAIGTAFAVTPAGWVAYAALLAVAALRGRALLRDELLASTAVVWLALTFVTHAIFFGSGRYGLLSLPLLTALAVLALDRARPVGRTESPRL